jgi:chromosome segregation ATPase
MKEQVMLANEQIKSLESELERNMASMHAQADKISSLKEKRREQKNEIRGLCDDKLELEVQRGNIDKELGELRDKYSKVQRDRDAQEQLIEKLEFKLRED